MERTENVELTVLCLIQDGDWILLQNRVKRDWLGYTLPGGHVEPGESFVDAVKREMKEETGLDILNPRLAGIKQFPIADGRYIVLLFKTDQFAGEVVSSEEGQMEWIDRHKLSEINAVDDLEELLKVIENPGLLELMSAPWYAELITPLIITAAIVVVLIIIMGILMKKDKEQ